MAAGSRQLKRHMRRCSGQQVVSAVVAISGDTAIVASIFDDDGGSDSGSWLYFTRGADGAWSQTSKLTAADAAAGDFFGAGVSISGDTAIVGAYLDDDGGIESRLCLYFYPWVRWQLESNQ